MKFLLNFILKQLNFEEIVIVTIFERLAALEADIAALKSAPAPVPAPDGALEARVAVLEGEIGTPPADPPQ